MRERNQPSSGPASHPTNTLGRVAEVWSSEYVSRRNTGPEHELAEPSDAPPSPLAIPHFDTHDVKGIEWAWWGIGLQLAEIPLFMVLVIVINATRFYALGILPLFVPMTILFILGLRFSLRSLLVAYRSYQPLLTLLLSLIGLAVGAWLFIVFVPKLLDPQLDLQSYQRLMQRLFSPPIQ